MGKPKVFKLFQKNRQPLASKQVQIDEDANLGKERDNRGILKATSTSPGDQHKSTSAKVGKKGKLRRFFGKSRRKSQNHAQKHNETFTTADTEDTNNEESNARQQGLDLFPDLRVASCTTELQGALASTADDCGESWKDFVCDDANPEGIEASVVHRDSDYVNMDRSLRSFSTHKESLFSELDLVGFEEPDHSDAAKARNQVVPDTAEFVEVGIEADIGLQAVATMHPTVAVDAFESIEEPVFPFPSLNLPTDIPGFLSPDQESKLGTPARASKASCSNLHVNPAAVTLQSLVITKNEDASQCSSDAHELVVRRNLTDVSTLDGNPFADAEGQEDNGREFAGVRDVFDELDDELQDEDVTMEPSIEASIASPVKPSSSATFESQPEGVACPFSFVNTDAKASISAEEDFNSMQLASLLLMPPPPPPPPPPIQYTPHRQPREEATPHQLVDDDSNVVDLCASSVSSDSSAKTENNLLHHYKKGSSPHSWSAIKYGINSHLLAAEPNTEPPASYTTDRLEALFKEAQQDPAESICDRIERRSYQAESAADQTHTTSTSGAEACVPSKLQLTPNEPIAMAQSSVPGTDDAVEHDKDEPFDVAASHQSSTGRKEESQRNRLLRRTLLTLANGGSQLHVIPEQMVSSDIITAPLTHNYRRLCSNFMQHAIVEGSGDQKALKKLHKLLLDQGGSVTDDESVVDGGSELSLDETPTLTLVNSESDSIDDDCVGTDQNPYYKQLPVQRIHQHIAAPVGRERMSKQVRFSSETNTQLEEDPHVPRPANMHDTSRALHGPVEEKQEGENDTAREGIDEGATEDGFIGDVEEEQADDQPEMKPRFEAAHEEVASVESVHASGRDVLSDEESRDTLTDFYKQRTRELANRRLKSKNKRNRGDARKDNLRQSKTSGLSFLSIPALDRFVDCSFCSAHGASEDEFEVDFYDDESILTYDDEGTYETFDSRDFGGKFGIEDDVEEALEWADRNMLCGGRNR